MLTVVILELWAESRFFLNSLVRALSHQNDKRKMMRESERERFYASTARVWHMAATSNVGYAENYEKFIR